MTRIESPAYLEQLDAYLTSKNLKGTVYYGGCWDSYTDIQRFEAHLDSIAAYHSLSGAAVLDMGAGTGGLLLACQGRGASRLVGVEVNPFRCRTGCAGGGANHLVCRRRFGSNSTQRRWWSITSLFSGSDDCAARLGWSL